MLTGSPHSAPLRYQEKACSQLCSTPQPLFIAVSQIRHCHAHATLCRLAEPMHSTLPVLLHAVAVFIAYAQLVHTFTVTLIRRRAPSTRPRRAVGFHADPVVEGAGSGICPRANRIPPPCSITQRPVSRPEPCQCRIDSTRPAAHRIQAPHFHRLLIKPKKPEPDPPPRRFHCSMQMPRLHTPHAAAEICGFPKTIHHALFIRCLCIPKSSCLKPSNHLRSYRLVGAQQFPAALRTALWRLFAFIPIITGVILAVINHRFQLLPPAEKASVTLFSIV